ncbi:hypothetical protein CJP04_29065 [Klebsiella pneumoniae]|nr:hypothetical protein CJP04_29065 [Klebsiella pneumoniae]
MMDYRTSWVVEFLHYAGVSETPDEVAAQARYLDDGLLFLQEGKIIALLPWQQGDNFPLLQEQQTIIEIAGLGGHLIRGLGHAGVMQKFNHP